MLVKFSNLQKLLISLNIAVLGAAVGFSFMVWYYLSRIPEHLQTPFLRSQYEPSRLDGLSAVFIYGSTTISGFIIAFIFIFFQHILSVEQEILRIILRLRPHLSSLL